MNRYKKRVGKLVRALRTGRVRAVLWWWKQDRRYGVFWRAANFLAAALILVSVVIPVATELWQNNQYKLSADAISLVGQTDTSLSNQLKYDSQTKTYEFNKDAIAGNDLPSKLQKVSVGASDKSNAKTYALDVPTDISKGVTYHDTNSQLSFSLIPQFKAMDGKTEQGHIVFPLDGGNQAVYTLKNNGLKEDIVVPKTTIDTMSFSYTLKLPNTLEAKVIPGSGGALGIYSADPALFGDINYGSNADQARVEKARVAGAKTYLVFGLPTPVIKAPNDASVGQATARFELNGDRLSVIAENLLSAKTAITIDPSVVVTSSSDFQTNGNNEGNIDFSTSGQIARGGVIGASVGSYTTSGNTLPAAQQNMPAIAYNGYMYVVGGQQSSGTSVYYTALNSNGSIGSWASTTSLNTTRNYGAAVAYNGYLYAYGGYDGSIATATVEYAPINSNGTVGTWVTSANAMSTGVCRLGYAVYSGYLYATGGNNTLSGACTNASTPTNIVQYAPILANGDVGTWSTTNTFTTARQAHSTVAYNGYLYIMAGTVDGTTNTTTTQYAQILPTGAVSSWMSTTSIPGSRYRQAAVVYNGYVYLTGGASGASSSDTIYAPIYATGALGAWQTSGSFTTPRFSHGMVAYNNFLYVVGGANGTPQDTTEYTPIKSAGTLAPSVTSSGNFPSSNTRRGHASVAYNGYLYVIGGDAGSTPVTSVYSTALSADGSIGSYGTTTVLPTGLTMASAVAYNGKMYVLGGCTSALSSCTTSSNNVATVYMGTIGATGNVTSWTAQTSFTTSRYGAGAVAYNGYLYLVGGLNGSTFKADVQYAQPDATTGAITSWTAAGGTYDLATARAGFAVTVNNGYMYLAGGCSAGDLSTCTTVNNDLLYIQLSDSGGPATTWSTGTSFTAGRYGLGLAVSGGYIYAYGGYDGTTVYDTVQISTLSTNGSNSSWSSVSVTLSSPEWGIGYAAYQGTLYATGGYSGSAYSTKTRYANINNGGGGAVGTWTTNATGIATPYPSGWTDGGSFAANGYLYMVGGFDGTNAVATCYYAPISADGSVGSWTSTTSLNTARYELALTTYNGYVYAVSGQNTANTYQTSVEYATINANGTLGTWTTSGNAVAGSRIVAGIAAYNGYIYLLGGENSSAAATGTTQFASLNATTGAPGTWATTNSFTTSRYGAASVAYNGYIYIIGGYTGSAYISNVQYALLNSDGTITNGAWKQTTNLPFNWRYMQAYAYNGYIYAVQGGNATVNAQRAASVMVQSDGTLGVWQTTSNTFGSQRYRSGSAFYNGYLYLVGGTDSTPTLYTDVFYAPLNTIPRVGTYSKMIDLGWAQKISGISYSGALSNGIADITYRSAGTDGVFGSSATASSIAATGSCTTNLTGVRYLLITARLDDTRMGSFADSSGAIANLTDFTVSYLHGLPPANIRMRVGQTLQAGIQSSLDTCKQ